MLLPILIQYTSRNCYIVFFIPQAEKYGQFADNTAFMAQQKEKNKVLIEKKKIKEVTYYRQGNQVSVLDFFRFMLVDCKWP